MSPMRPAESCPSAVYSSMLRSRNAFRRASASCSLASYDLICSPMNTLAESASLRLALRRESTKIDTSDWITRRARVGSRSRKASVYRLLPAARTSSVLIRPSIWASCAAFESFFKSRSAMRTSFSTLGRLMSVRLSIAIC